MLRDVANQRDSYSWQSVGKVCCENLATQPKSRAVRYAVIGLIKHKHVVFEGVMKHGEVLCVLSRQWLGHSLSKSDEME